MIDHVRRGMAHSQSWMSRLLPGFSLALLVAMSGQFVAEHSNAPSMMMKPIPRCDRVLSFLRAQF